MQIELNQEEVDVLAHVLEERSRELRFEIAHTDHREYKRSLNHRLEVLESIVEHVQIRKSPARSIDVA